MTRLLLSCLSLCLVWSNVLAGACFCPTDDHDNIYFDCVEEKSTSSTQTGVVPSCYDKAMHARRPVSGAELMRKIPAGSDSCMPCRIHPGFSGLNDVPRDGEDPGAPSTHRTD